MALLHLSILICFAVHPAYQQLSRTTGYATLMSSKSATGHTFPTHSIPNPTPATGSVAHTSPGLGPSPRASTFPSSSIGLRPLGTVTQPMPSTTTTAPRANLTGDNVCHQTVTESRYMERTVELSCFLEDHIGCYLCPGCERVPGSDFLCIKLRKGRCQTKIRQYEPVDVSRNVCCQGFEPSGNICIRSVNCAQANGNCQHICRSDKENGRHCECYQGYQLQNNVCENFDECSFQNGGCSHQCVDTLGSYYCQCPRGYLLETRFQCAERDECTEANGGCAHSCVNTVGQFHCTCRNGYELKNGKECIDIDECAEGVCSHDCENFEGSYKCSCPSNLFLFKNRTCINPEDVVDGAQVGGNPTTFSREALIATLSAVAVLVILVIVVWVVCCYWQNTCCFQEEKRENRKNKRHDVDAIVVQYSNRKQKEPPSDPPAYTNQAMSNGPGGSDSEYNTHARMSNGLPEKEVVDGEIHILPDIGPS